MDTMLNTHTLAVLLQLPDADVAPAWSPSEMFAGWGEDGTSITVPIASFVGLTADAADGINGDARQVWLSMCAEAFEWYNEVAPQPEAMVAKYTPGQMQVSGDFEGKQKAEFRFTFYLDYPEGTVTAEVEE